MQFKKVAVSALMVSTLAFSLPSYSETINNTKDIMKKVQLDLMVLREDLKLLDTRLTESNPFLPYLKSSEEKINQARKAALANRLGCRMVNYNDCW